jgi:hypothetical protein
MRAGQTPFQSDMMQRCSASLTEGGDGVGLDAQGACIHMLPALWPLSVCAGNASIMPVIRLDYMWSWRSFLT